MLPCTERRNKYVLTAMDYFTQWPEAYSLLDQGAKTIADTIHSDQGRNSEKFFAALSRLDMQKTRTTPCTPRGTAWWSDFIALWSSSWPLFRLSISGTGTLICLWCSWITGQLSRSRRPACLLCRSGPIEQEGNLQRKKGRCPKLDGEWIGPWRVLERMGEVVYRVQ